MPWLTPRCLEAFSRTAGDVRAECALHCSRAGTPFRVTRSRCLRARFLALAIKLRLADVDAAAIRLAEPHGLTQAIAAWLYEQSARTGGPSPVCSSPPATVTG
jgi:hypothetical protein